LFSWKSEEARTNRGRHWKSLEVSMISIMNDLKIICSSRKLAIWTNKHRSPLGWSSKYCAWVRNVRTQDPQKCTQSIVKTDLFGGPSFKQMLPPQFDWFPVGPMVIVAVEPKFQWEKNSCTQLKRINMMNVPLKHAHGCM
jgi:hypothetical protein